MKTPKQVFFGMINKNSINKDYMLSTEASVYFPKFLFNLKSCILSMKNSFFCEISRFKGIQV